MDIAPVSLARNHGFSAQELNVIRRARYEIISDGQGVHGDVRRQFRPFIARGVAGRAPVVLVYEEEDEASEP